MNIIKCILCNLFVFTLSIGASQEMSIVLANAGSYYQAETLELSPSTECSYRFTTQMIPVDLTDDSRSSGTYFKRCEKQSSELQLLLNIIARRSFSDIDFELNSDVTVKNAVEIRSNYKKYVAEALGLVKVMRTNNAKPLIKTALPMNEQEAFSFLKKMKACREIFGNNYHFIIKKGSHPAYISSVYFIIDNRTLIDVMSCLFVKPEKHQNFAMTAKECL